MAACETCWAEATRRALLLGGSVADHYATLLTERAAAPCPPVPLCYCRPEVPHHAEYPHPLCPQCEADEDEGGREGHDGEGRSDLTA